MYGCSLFIAPIITFVVLLNTTTLKTRREIGGYLFFIAACVVGFYAVAYALWGIAKLIRNRQSK